LFFFTFVSFGESRLFILWCAGGRCDMACSDEGHDRSRKSGAEDQGSHTGQVLDGQVIERSDDAVCDLHRAREDEDHEFLD
jgi:hypothetical protein